MKQKVDVFYPRAYLLFTYFFRRAVERVFDFRLFANYTTARGHPGRVRDDPTRQRHASPTRLLLLLLPNGAEVPGARRLCGVSRDAGLFRFRLL